MTQRTIDTHTHVLAAETAALLTKEVSKVPVTITDIDKDIALLDVGGVSYKPFPRGGFDIDRRLARHGRDRRRRPRALRHAADLSCTTRTLALAAAAAVIQNDQMAKHIAAHPTRFLGIATLPIQDPKRAADELKRVMTKLGLKGAMIGSNAMGKNLDDPSFEPLWATANELGAFMFIHPNNVAGADRLKSYYLRNLIGNPLDTTIAAASLYFGGVLDKHPKMTVMLAHGGGFTPYQAARWEHGWRVRPEPKKNIAQEPKNIAKRFFYDTILHSDKTLEMMIDLVGVDHVMLGSDYPYDMAMLDCVAHVRALNISDADKDTILGGHAEALLSGKAS